MSFTDFAYLPFFLGVLVLIRLVPAPNRWLVLLGMSCLFYGWEEPRLLFLVWGVIFVAWKAALAIEKASSEKAAKHIMIWAAALCLLVLFCFKYLNWTMELMALPCREHSVPKIILPLGISFYTFQALSYVVDVWRKRIPAERSLLKVGGYLLFFPQLVAGPIERAGDLLPQLSRPEPTAGERSIEALLLLLRGYTKKVVIADNLAPLVDFAYQPGANPGGCALLAATLFFSAQIYCDFSGYTDIARGCAGLLGIKLSENFRKPWQAVSVHDFWRRWHLTLTGWLRDYLYIPLGGNRHSLRRQCVLTLLVFLLSGLWHGANFTFVLWGLCHGGMMVLETLIDHLYPDVKKKFRRPFSLMGILLAWVFFRAESVGQATDIFRRIFFCFFPSTLISDLGGSAPRLLMGFLLLLLVPLVEDVPALENRKENALIPFFLLLCIFISRAGAVSGGTSPSFIYFRF